MRGLHLSFVEVHLLAAEQILHGRIAHLRVEHSAAEQLVDAGNGLAGDARGAAVGQRLAHLRSGGRRHGDDDLADRGFAPVQVAHHGDRLAAGTEHLDAHDARALLERIVIQEAFDLVAA